jgi:excisionase family DNA binding protein
MKSRSPDAPVAPDKLLTTTQVAETLGLTVDSARKRLRRGQFPGAVRLGHQWRVKQNGLQAWIATLAEDWCVEV